MSKFHSTVSRRNFMKGLGLAGAGLGAAAAATPVFHDIDEITSSKGSSSFPITDGLKKHSGAKKRSTPTLIVSPSGSI